MVEQLNAHTHCRSKGELGRFFSFSPRICGLVEEKDFEFNVELLMEYLLG